VLHIVLCKGKVHPRRGHEGPDVEERYSSAISLTSALDGSVCGQRHTPATLPLGKTQYLFYRRLGGPQGRSGQVQKISPPPGFNPRTVQPIASNYTDWTALAHIVVYIVLCTMLDFINKEFRKYMVTVYCNVYKHTTEVNVLYQSYFQLCLYTTHQYKVEISHIQWWHHKQQACTRWIHSAFAHTASRS